MNGYCYGITSRKKKKKNELANFRFLDSRSLEVNFMQ
jgi:hypothetical protein